MAASSSAPKSAGPRHRRARPDSPPPAAADVRGIRTVRLRTNRIVNTVCLIGVVVAAFLLFLGAYLTDENGWSGLVICAVAIILAWAFGRRLGPGRLLTLDVTGADVHWVNSFEPSRSFPRTRGLRAVIWIARRYQGASPKLRGLFLVEADGTVRLTTKPATFSQERLERFFTTVQIPVEVVDNVEPPFPPS